MITTVLIVEDEMLIALTYKLALEQEGFKVQGMCAKGAQAIESIRQNQPDALVLDIALQDDVNGLDVARFCAAAASDLPILFVTGNYDEETRQRALELEPVEFLIKPIDPGQITEIFQALG